MKNVVLVISFMLIGQQVFSQNEDDALRYSQTFFGGTARNSAMAGAMTAIGGDFSVVTQNPAGLGRLRKSNFSTTLNVENPSTNADFYGSLNKDRGTAANLSNLSYVKAYTLNPKKYSNWYGVQLGMGMTRIKSFQQRIEYKGSSDSSILHSFIQEANGTPDSLIYDIYPFTSGLAYDVFGIDPAPGNQYVTDFTSGTALHNRSITRKGGMSEYSFSLSGNYANKLYVGGSFNLTRVKYSESFEHKESYSDTSLWLQSINYSGTLDIDGWGYGLRLGAIFLPTDWVSVGVSAQLPTAFRLSDSWSNTMSAETDEGSTFVDPANVPDGQYDYRISTPFKGNVSLGFVLEKFGSIGLEVEYIDYGSASLKDNRFSDAPYGFVGENFQIENIYQSVLNYKIGVEARITSQLYLRGGYAFYDSPFKEGKGNAQNPTQFFTGGVGYNWGVVYADLACIVKQSKENYFAYDPTISGSRVTLDGNDLNFKLSLGFRF